jgi:hypothetical protein
VHSDADCSYEAIPAASKAEGNGVGDLLHADCELSLLHDLLKTMVMLSDFLEIVGASGKEKRIRLVSSLLLNIVTCFSSAHRVDA